MTHEQKPESAADAKAKRRAKMESLMFSGRDFTFTELWRLVDGSPVEGPEYREADALIQRHRKAGLIAVRRAGRDRIWSLTEAGRKAAEDMQP